MLKAFLEEKAVAAVRATRPPLPAGADDDEDTASVIRAAKAAAGVETALWAEGVVTRRIYDLVHRRFLIALAPLGTAISQMEASSGGGEGRVEGRARGSSYRDTIMPAAASAAAAAASAGARRRRR